MVEHLTDEQIDNYRQRTSPSAHLLTMDHHLAGCEPCRQRLHQAGRLQPAFDKLLTNLRTAAEAEPDHLSYEELEAYVEAERAGSLDEVTREIIDTHVELCTRCAGDLEELRGFAAMMVEEPVTVPEKKEATSRWQSWLASIGVQFPLSGWSNVLQFSSIAAAVVLLIGCSWLVYQNLQLRSQMQAEQASREQEKQQLATARSQSDELKSELERERANKAQLEQALAAQPQGPLRIGALVNLPAEVAALNPEAPPVTGFSREKLMSLVGPVGTVVQDDRPVFRWQPFPLATGYQVKVYAENNSTDPSETSESLAATEWKVTRPLPRGKVYAWEVIALREGEEIARSAKVKFKVLEAAKANFLELAKKQYANSPLTLGTLYAQAGLVDDAEREFQTVLDSNQSPPETQQLARQMLQSIKAARGTEPRAKTPR